MLAQAPCTHQAITHVEPIAPYKLHVRFQDGTEGTVDLTKLIDFKGSFAPLRDDLFFAQALVEPKHGAVIWPNRATLSPSILYAQPLCPGDPAISSSTSLTPR
jgi:hypothetical protein